MFSSWLAVGAAILGCALLIWRRRHPLVVIAVVAPAFVASILWHLDSGTVLLFVTWVALYGVPAYAPRRQARIVGVAVLVTAIGVLALMAATTQDQTRGGIGLAAVTIVGYLGSAWFLGKYHHARRNAIAAEERARIARELHDTLAHTLSGMVVLAGGGRRAVQTNPEAAVAVLAKIEEVGRHGMTETRMLLDSLHAPTLDDLSTLVDRVRDTGLPIEVSTRGDATVPVSVGRAAYRIVQESLTNVLRHAGPATARVDVRYGPDTLEVQVLDDGHGLAGMRERAALAGGELRAGPRDEGGWAVRATFPVKS
jgi:signal transduction histidine kinase